MVTNEIGARVKRKYGVGGWDKWGVGVGASWGK